MLMATRHCRHPMPLNMAALVHNARMKPLHPLSSLKIVEFEGIGPGPMCGLMLAQLGAQVTVVKRPNRPGVGAALPDAPGEHLGLDRGKKSVTLNLKEPVGVGHALALIAKADVLIEGLRPGAMEKLGLGPKICHALNPKLVYGRMTGWGQTGPLAHAAGHDLNYVALTGLLSLTLRDGQPPIVPPTVVGDAAGALGLAFGIASAALHALATGKGCVVDAAMCDITAMLGALMHLTEAAGSIARNPADPLADSVFHGSPFYDTYLCSDGRYVTICALEPAFYAELLTRLGLTDERPEQQFDKSGWDTLKAKIKALFASQPMAHWCALLEGTDVCFAPVLTMREAAAHPHMSVRKTLHFVDAGLARNGQPKTAVQASVAPRFWVD